MAWNINILRNCMENNQPCIQLTQFNILWISVVWKNINETYFHLLFRTTSSENPNFLKKFSAELSAWTTTASYLPTTDISFTCCHSNTFRLNQWLIHTMKHLITYKHTLLTFFLTLLFGPLYLGYIPQFVDTAVLFFSVLFIFCNFVYCCIYCL